MRLTVRVPNWYPNLTVRFRQSHRSDGCAPLPSLSNIELEPQMRQLVSFLLIQAFVLRFEWFLPAAFGSNRRMQGLTTCSKIVQESLADLGLDGRTCAAGRQHDDVHDSARVGYRRFPLALSLEVEVVS